MLKVEDRSLVQASGSTVLRSYQRIVRRRCLMLCVLAVFVICAFAVDVASGPAGISVSTLVTGLIDPTALSRPLRVVIFDIRLPTSLLAMLVGAALSLAGAEMQTILDNPLASPFTLGISSAATFGAALGIVLDLHLPGIAGSWIVPVNAFIFALGASMLLLAVARSRTGGGHSIVLFGIALFFSFNALVALTQFIASEQSLQQLVFWTLGSLARASWEKDALLAGVVVVMLPLAIRAAWQLTALRLGEERARTLGVNVERLRLASVLRVSLLTGASVAFVGTIGFIGLVAPHIARFLVGEDHRFFLPASALCGSLVMLLAAVAAKTIVPGTIVPIGIVTALAGVPIFFALILFRASDR